MRDDVRRYDFDHIECIAKKYIDDGNFADAIKIHIFISDGDP